MSDSSDDMETYSGLIEDYEDYNDEMELLRKKLSLALWALKKINEEELNSQRPGGGYSSVAKLSYNVINKIARME
jgi:hypothetical protein